jgi:hypothetical protein
MLEIRCILIRTFISGTFSGSSKQERTAAHFGSENLCGAISAALGSARSHRDLEFTVNWPNNRIPVNQPYTIPPNQPYTRITFPTYLAGIIGEAATLLHTSAEIDEFELEDSVYKMT